MFYELQCFYYRDVYFLYSDENETPYTQAIKGNIDETHRYIYHIDRIEPQLTSYDILPTIGPSLVSKRFAETFSDLIGREIQLFDTVIKDDAGNMNHDFYMLLVLHRLSCIDKTRSKIEEKTFRDGSKAIRIHQLFINASKTENRSIFSLEEKPQYRIINEAFKNKCEPLKGFNFIQLNTHCS